MKKRILFLSRMSVLAVITLTASMVMAAGTPPPAPSNPLYPPGIGWNPVVDYTLPNFAQSPNIRKFVDSLPGLGVANANNLGQYIPLATPDTTTFPGDNVSSAANPASDYYEIAVREYHQKMHTDMPATQLRGYGQINSADPTVNNVSQYLGPMIIAHRYDPTKPAGVNGNGKPVRVKYFNQLPTGAGGQIEPAGGQQHHGRGIRPQRRHLKCTPRTASPSTSTAAPPRGSATERPTSGRPRRGGHLLRQGREQRERARHGQRGRTCRVRRARASRRSQTTASGRITIPTSRAPG